MATVMKAIGNKFRIKILYVLMDGPLSVRDIGLRIKLNQMATEEHLLWLTGANLVKAERDKKWTFYSINEPVKDLLKFIISTISELDKK